MTSPYQTPDATGEGALWPGLPQDAELVYILPHEAWYRSVVHDRSISIIANAAGGGCYWEFTVVEDVLGGRSALQLRIYDDAFSAFAEIPQFFTALEEQNPVDLPSLCRLLDGLGVRDSTERWRPNVTDGRDIQVARKRADS